MYYKNSAKTELPLPLTPVYLKMLPVSTEKLHSIYKSCKNVICTDTRNILPGSLFFCLKGPAFDGNRFANEALEKGAAYVVADDPEVVTSEKILYTPDALKMLQDLATFHRKSIGTHILAIGGSNGKTTTKELCLAVTGKRKKVHATKANLNNHIGVPLTLLELKGDEDVGIIELGTNHPGEMKVLCDIVLADSGIITNIGKEHLEGFGSLEEVAREESELYRSLLETGGMAFVNVDDPWLANMSKRISSHFTYGIHNASQLRGILISGMPNLVFQLDYLGKIYGPYTAQMGGEYNLYNILAAVSMGIHTGMNIDESALAACDYKPSNNRSEWREQNGRKIWLDAYNANPSSMEVALRSFAGLNGSKTVILGDMLELGDFAPAEHSAILKLAEELGFDEILLSGPEFTAASAGRFHAFPETDALVQFLKDQPAKSGYILIKGSRGMRMEKVLEVL